MTNPISREALMRYLDGECTAEERDRIRAALDGSTELNREMAIFRAMKEDFQDLSFQPPSREVSVWSSVNRRIARPTAWLLIVVGVTVWCGWAVYLFATSPVNLFEKLTIGAIIVGVLILLVSVSWEQYQVWKTDPYRKVHR